MTLLLVTYRSLYAYPFTGTVAAITAVVAKAIQDPQKEKERLETKVQKKEKKIEKLKNEMQEKEKKKKKLEEEKKEVWKQKDEWWKKMKELKKGVYEAF